MSQRGPIHPIAGLSIAQMPPFLMNFAVPRSPGRADEDSTDPVSTLSQTIWNATIMPFTLLSDDELIAQLLIHTWTLTTGKTLRGDVPPHELTEAELIDFWSDDRFD